MTDDLTQTETRTQAHALGNSDVTPAQYRQMIQWAVEDGSLSPDEANAQLQAAGADPLQDTRQDPNNPAAQIDAAFPPADPLDYDLPPLVGENETYTEQHREQDMLRRNWLTTGRFPKALGDSLMKQAERTAAKYRDMDENSRELYARAEFTKAQELFGGGSQEALGLAMQLAEEIDIVHGGFFAWLDESGAGDDSFVIAQMALQAQRLRDRRGG